MKKRFLAMSGLFLSVLLVSAQPRKAHNPSTFCNPLDISYRFRPDTPSRREAADPVIVLFKNNYFLFASKSGGYWVSNDLNDWRFITNGVLPWEAYAPAVAALGDELIFMASEDKRVFKTSDPINGQWTECGSVDIRMTDPCFFLDDDKKLYLYYGCSNKKPTYGVELDVENGFRFKGAPVELIHANTLDHGFEQPGDHNEGPSAPWIEGTWMTKHNGKYYLQYAAPGTQYKSYSDGVYVADRPFGPYTYQNHNPFCHKPEGFINGAGHSGAFRDKFGNYWRITTLAICVKQMFERRLGLFPMYFDADGVLATETAFGDYPQWLPTKANQRPNAFGTGWSLLSYGCPVTTSSCLDTVRFAARFAVDEEVKTAWSAATGGQAEWMAIDLGDKPLVKAVQVNFSDVATKSLGRPPTENGCRYVIEKSNDGTNWETLIDNSQSQKDRPHAYFELEKPVRTRFLRIRNISVPDGLFAISGFRAFGKGAGKKPKAPEGFAVERDKNDPRHAVLKWSPVPGATGYLIRYGISPKKLYAHHLVHSDAPLHIRYLNRGQAYVFTIQAFSGNGLSGPSKGAKVGGE